MIDSDRKREMNPVQLPQLIDLCKQFNLTDYDIGVKRVSDAHIQEIFSQLKESEWELVAMHTGLSLCDVEAIKCPGKPDTNWPNFIKTCTYQELLEALLKAEFLQLAIQVCGK